ncbi:MAG TPA: hypothetical protein VNF06_03685 [Candidatus Aquilonibacter sp.]|nr:hypothetical protein [Candidatus Aquilonibacter sp.]
MANGICVCCGNKGPGLPIEIDGVIRGLRLVKERLRMKVNNNRLVWCKECYPKHAHATKSAAESAGKKDYPVVVLEDAGRHPNEWVERAGYEASRKGYESRQMRYLAIGVVFAVLGVIISPAVWSIIAAILVVLFLYLMSLLTYAPKITSISPK